MWNTNQDFKGFFEIPQKENDAGIPETKMLFGVT